MFTKPDIELLINASINVEKTIIQITQLGCNCSKTGEQCSRCKTLLELRRAKLFIDCERLKLN